MVTMKMAKEREIIPKEKSISKPKKTLSVDIDSELFELLRKLRTEIAKEEKMPPYIIFNDKTLIEMCGLLPISKAEMLKVSGVGEVKYEKYGERFMDIIKKASL